jgi:hypothetical protein
MAGHQGGPAAKAFEDFGGSRESSPWSGGGGGDLAREAGLDDLRGGRSSSGSDDYARPAGLFDSASNESEDDGDFDGGDTEEV